MKKTILNILAGLIVLFVLNSCNHSRNLFKEGESDWDVYGDAKWGFSNNELIGNVTDGDGFVLTKQKFQNFVIELEFNPDSTINSGVFIRCSKNDINPTDCYEVNIWDLHPDQNNRTGAIVTRMVPKEYLETINKWNTYKIKAEEGHLQIWINNILVNEMQDGSLIEGYIGLQAKGTGEIRFRNMKITPL